jgi:hypothetical protein
MLIFIAIFIRMKKYFISSNMHYCGVLLLQATTGAGTGICGVLLLPATTGAGTGICGVLLLPATTGADTGRSSSPSLSDSSTLAAILIPASS